jgi:hypothetical protein
VEGSWNPFTGQGQAAEAESLLRQSLTIRGRDEPDVWTTFETCSLLGAALMAMGKPAEARPVLRDGYDGLKARTDKIPWAARVRIAEAGDRSAAADRATDPDGPKPPRPTGAFAEPR